MDKEGYQTPGREQDDKQQAGTAVGATQSRFQHGMAESKFQRHQEDQGKNSRAQQLDAIEAELKEAEKRLKEVYYELQKETDKNSDHAIDLEQERAGIKKRIIDLDFEHKVLMAQTIKESRRKQEEQKQRMIKEAQQQRERRRQQIEQRLEKSRQQRQSKDAEQGQKVTGSQEEGKEQGQQGKLDESRRRLRIAEIEAELAESRLRRSRIASLNYELDYLRYSYRYPLWYDYPSVYPYPSYYSSLSLYPYPYSYSYPYSYIPRYPYRYWPL